MASALQGHGYDTGFYDLSLEFYHQVLASNEHRGSVARALRYLTNGTEYTPMEHRSAAGAINRALKRFSVTHPGWRLTAMDILAPQPVHQPHKIQLLLQTDDPFVSLWENRLEEILRAHRPKKVIISLAYLSQLTATISLTRFLTRCGIAYSIGGSLPRSLHATGEGFELLQSSIGPIDVSNGSSLIPHICERDFLNRLEYPQVICNHSYISARPILPLTLSTGCYWSKCLFCPDNTMKYIQLQMDAFVQFFQSIPPAVQRQNPVIHLLDSSMPKNQLRRFAPIAKSFNLQYYGFARPEKQFADELFLDELANSGCLMLQLGVESGNGDLLQRYEKGINPEDAAKVLQMVSSAGIRTYVYLLFGLPGETESQRLDTQALIKTNIEHVDFLNLSIFNLPKHCILTSRADEFGITLKQYQESQTAIELYRPFTVNNETHRNTTRSFIHSHFTNDEQIRPVYLQTPKWFRAAHLALMKLPGRISQ